MKKYLLAVVLGFVITVFLANTFAKATNEFVKVEKVALSNTAQRSYIVADDNTVLARLFLENREDVSLDLVPKPIQKAFIAIEDERFYEHSGVDYYGIMRALVENIKHRQVVEGGSTITQQYVKNSLGAKDQTITRKIREAVVAARLEKKYKKDEILEAYLNTIYFGQGAYGIEAAAEVFFAKKAPNLTLAEGALLAGVTKSPTHLSPYTHPEKAHARQGLVLDNMVRQGYITEAEAEAAKNEYPKLASLKREQVIAPYFVEYVKKILIDKYGVEKVFKGGLKVYTSLNIEAQKTAEDAIAKKLYERKDPDAALVSLRPKTGHIIAMVGGRNFDNLKYNLATQGKRQPGSAFKPFVLVTALKQGIKPTDTFNSSSPQAICISKSRYAKPWIVHNSEGKGYGSMPLREATVHSVNAVYANLTVKIGADKVAETAQQMGIETPIQPFPSIGIGGLTVGVSPLEMASAYGTLANLGLRVKPQPIIKIVDFKGNVIDQPKPETSRAISGEVAYQAIDIMKGVIARGTATRANIGRPAAGKTGTNGQYRDAWFVGFTPDLATSVWMGYHDAQISMYNVHGSRGFGGIIPASIWHDFMSFALKDTPARDFPRPGTTGNKDENSESVKSDSSDESGTYSKQNKRRRRSSQEGNRSRTPQQITPQTAPQAVQEPTPQTTPRPVPQTTPPTTPPTAPPASVTPPTQRNPAPPPSNNPSPTNQGQRGSADDRD